MDVTARGIGPDGGRRGAMSCVWCVIAFAVAFVLALRFGSRARRRVPGEREGKP